MSNKDNNNSKDIKKRPTRRSVLNDIEYRDNLSSYDTSELLSKLEELKKEKKKK